METTIDTFLQELSSASPTPGGGGASALIGAIGVSLCSMVANLTTGKKKYVKYQQDIDDILARVQTSISRLVALVQKDADVFIPLAHAYGIAKDDPKREGILEDALHTACSVPLEIMQEITNILDVLEQLMQKGSRLAVSDVGVAAAACRCSLEGAVMNVYINTKLMKDREYAQGINTQAALMAEMGIARCQDVYQSVSRELRGSV